MLPILFQIKGLIIYSYPLMVGVATGLAYLLLQNFVESKKITTKYFNLIFLGCLFFSWLGAKVFFLIFSGFEETKKIALNSNFWIGGGFVFYGGFIATSLFILFVIFILKKWKWEEGKYFFPVLLLSHGVGRIGCFLAGCCFGHQSTLFWAIEKEGKNIHPVQIYESLLLLFLGFIFLKIIEKLSTLQALIYYLLLYGASRFFLEFFRGDLVRGEIFNLSSSQFISIILIIMAISLKIISNKMDFFKKY